MLISNPHPKKKKINIIMRLPKKKKRKKGKSQVFGSMSNITEKFIYLDLLKQKVTKTTAQILALGNLV